MLHTEKFNPTPGQRYCVVATEPYDWGHNIRVSIFMDGELRTITVLGKIAEELGGIRQGDDLVFGEHAALERVEHTKEATACASTNASASYELDERARHRHDLERMSMSALADAVAKSPNHAKETGEAMRAAIDALLGKHEPAKQACTCGPQEGCTAYPKPGTATVTEARRTYVTPDDIEAEISAEFYFTGDDGVNGAAIAKGGSFAPPDVIRHDDANAQGPMGLLTFCVLLLRNGTKVVGVNYGAIDPARHDPDMGRVEARKAAIEQVWPLLGYELRTQLARPVLTDGDAQADLDGTRRPDNHID